MKIIDRSVPSDILLQTVSLSQNDTNPDNVYMFRCYHCGTAISKVKGNVASITPGFVPSDLVIVINQCYSCKENYTFKTTKAKTGVIKITLAPQLDRTISTFHCVFSRTPLLQYNDTEAFRLPLMQRMLFPAMLGCTDLTCSKDYLLNDIVSL